MYAVANTVLWARAWEGATSTISNVLVGREDKRTNNRTMIPTLKNNAAAGYQGPVKIELLKGAGLLCENREI